jgi:hypothetical protein
MRSLPLPGDLVRLCSSGLARTFPLPMMLHDRLIKMDHQSFRASKRYEFLGKTKCVTPGFSLACLHDRHGLVVLCQHLGFRFTL